METAAERVTVARLGEARVPSPVRLTSEFGDGIANYVPETAHVRWRLEVDSGADAPEWLFERAGPRERIFFDPGRTRALIITCGGLCPGLNTVIRSLVLELHHNYGVREIYGGRYGYQALAPKFGHAFLRLTPEFVDYIHQAGGTVLGTSRGEQDIGVMADTLQRERFDLLFCVGGDGTLRGAARIAAELRRRNAPIAVVGIPKTIDNDIPFVSPSFGYATAVEQAARVVTGAHMEARSVFNGVGLVKLMGRDAGFIACGAVLASQEVNYALIPETPIVWDGPAGFLEHLRRRLEARRHAVVVVAEGVARQLASAEGKPGDIGPWLKERIARHCREHGTPVDIKYMDPSYYIRSVPANAMDNLLCDQMARAAAHAAMAGRTGLVIGRVHNLCVHVPMEKVAAEVKRVDPEGELWRSVLASTGQPHRWG